MKYRVFGKTGLQVSALGFGTMRFPVIGDDSSRIDEKKALKMVHHAIENGINYLDTAYTYHSTDFTKGGSSEPLLAKALSNGLREKVYLATKLPSWLIESHTDMDRYLDEQLKRLGTDYIDFYMLHALKRSFWDNLLKHDVLEFLEAAIKAGKIRYAGFSFHDEISLFKEITDTYDWTFCQIQYNYFDQNFQAGREGLVYASEKDLAVVIMEPLRGGSLVNNLPPEAKKIFNDTTPKRSLADWALRWLWNQSGVSIVLSGMSSMEQLNENLILAEFVSKAGWIEKDEAAIKEVQEIINKMQRIDCTYCGYCLPCPEGINIPRNLTLFNDYHLFNDKLAGFRYRVVLSEEEKASSCIACGECLDKCPQQISIPEELERVAELFK